jgi:D-aspartate ligase
MNTFLDNMKRHPVFILSLFDTGYYAARLLKKTGITIYGFDHDPNNPGFYSKHITSFVVPHPQADADKLLEILLNKRNEFSLKPILIAASENYLQFVHLKRTELENNFQFLLPDKDTLGKVINKSGQFEMAKKCGIDVPIFKTVHELSDLNDISGHIKYPVILKGTDQPKWKSKIKEKAFIALNKTDLQKIANQLFGADVPFIVQELISGEITNNFEYNALMMNGQIISQHVIQKIQQYPLGFGSACCVRTIEKKEVENLGLKFIKENQIEGFSNTEFKFDSSTEKYYFIETNARVWQQIELTSFRHENIVLSYYKQLTENHNLIKNNNCKKGLIWIDFPAYLLLLVRYRNKIKLGYFEFIKTIYKAKNFGLFNIFDLKPFLKDIRVIK